MFRRAVIETRRDRLADDDEIARQVEPTPAFPRKVDRRHWFRRAMTEGETIRTRLASY